MAKITIQFDSISEMESFRSQGQTAQSKTNTVFVVETNYDESTWINGIFNTLDKACKCYRDAIKTYEGNKNCNVNIMEWSLDMQCGKYLKGADLDID
jgi:hypothetical protein